MEIAMSATSGLGALQGVPWLSTVSSCFTLLYGIVSLILSYLTEVRRFRVIGAATPG